MTKRTNSMGSEFRVLRILFLALALIVPGVRAVAPPPAPLPERPGPGPLFAPEELHANPTHLSLALIGATATPQTGVVSALGVLAVGEWTNAWNLEGAMTNRYTRIFTGASTLMLNGFGGSTAPILELASLLHGRDLDCWQLIDTDRVRWIPKEWWLVVKDGTGIYAGNQETLTYARILIRSYYTSAKAFAEVARKELTFNHLIEEPDRYRGSVVHVRGRLLQINRYEPPPEAKEVGVGDLYEAWIFNEQFGSNPFVVIVPVWTPGLPHDLIGAGKIDKQVRVSVDGYFFKKFRYTSRDRSKSQRDTPLVIGHSLTLISTGDEGPTGQPPWVSNLIFGFVGMIALMIAFAVGLTLWFRRNDQRIRKRVMARMPEFALPPPDALPVAPPLAAPVRETQVTGHPPVAFPPRFTFPGGKGDRGGNPADGGPGNKDSPDEGAGA